MVFVKRLHRLTQTGETVGVCLEYSPEQEEFTYMIGVRNPNGDIDDLQVKDVPASKWAVFTSIGPMPGAIQNVCERIYTEWFPSTGFEHAEAPELEVYPLGDDSKDDYRCEVWIPVVKK